MIAQLQCVVFRLREVDQFKKVLQHPAYQKDPLAAISDHIRNSVSKGLT